VIDPFLKSTNSATKSPHFDRLDRVKKSIEGFVANKRAAGVPVARTDADLAKDLTWPDIQEDSGVTHDDAIDSCREALMAIAEVSIVPLLPLLFRLRGQPYSLENHFPMEPLFKKKQSPRFLFRCGRQVSKSTSLASQGVAHSATTPNFNSLFITPLFEQCRRFSANYVRPFIDESAMRSLLVGPNTVQQILQRSFLNNSSMFFSFCFTDVIRIRGIAADRVVVDEVQDINWDFLPVIMECMSASDYGLFQASGTPKTLDNTLEILWRESSMAEWCIRCTACNHWNICASEHDLIQMLQPQGLSCSKCNRLVNPRPYHHVDTAKCGTGQWVHSDRTKINEFSGYHAPQPIFPMHYEFPHKWKRLIEKMDPARTPRHIFFNEVLGEACDIGLKLITQADIRAASAIYNKPNKYKEALAARHNYAQLVMGVDWGGSTAPYGPGRQALLLDNSDATSYTTFAICGVRANGVIDVLYCYRFSLTSNHLEECQAILRAFRDFGCSIFAHDFGGSGSVRETLMLQSGLPLHAVMPIVYVHKPTGKMIETRTQETTKNRFYYSVDKARALILMAQVLKSNGIGLPSFDTSYNVTSDLLALMEDKVEKITGPDVLRIIRMPKKSDDFAHALTYGCMAIWHTKGYPNIADRVNLMFAGSAASLEDETDPDEIIRDALGLDKRP
jgi:hypothetical protein